MSDPERPETICFDEKPKRRPWTKWRCLRWIGRIIGLIICGILAAGYFGRGWLADRAALYIDERLQSKGIFSEYGDVSYELGRGVVLQDLVLFEAEAKAQPVLKISNLGFDMGLESFLTGESVDVKTLELSADDAVLEIFSGEKVAEVTGVQFFGVSKPEVVEITAAGGVLNGLNFHASGSVWKKPKKPTTEGNGEIEEEKPRKKLNLSWVGVIARLIDFEPSDRLPNLKVDFNLDLREDAQEKIRVAGSVDAGQCRWKGLPLDEAAGDFTVTWSDKMVEVSQAKIVYQGKPIEGRMRYGLDSKLLDVEQVICEVDLISFLGEQPINLAEKLKSFRCPEQPRFSFKGQIPVKDLKSSTVEAICEREGSLVIGQGEKALSIRLLEGNLKYQEGAVHSEKFSIGLFDGLANVAGGINLADNPVTYETGIAFAGMPLKSIMGAFGKESKWAGVVSGSFAGVGGFSFASIEGTGEFNLVGDDFKITGPISLKDAVVASNGLEANFGGGLLSASGQVDTTASPIAYEANAGFESVSMQSLLAFMGSEKKLAGSLSGSFKGTASNSLTSVAGEGEIRFDAGTYQIEGPFTLSAGAVESENVLIALGGGQIGIQGKSSIVNTPMVFEGSVQVDRVPVQSIIGLTKSERKVEGILSGQFQGSASNTVPSVVGGGAIRYETEKYQVEGPFALKEGIVESDNLVIALGGGRIGIRGKGNLVDAPMVFDGGILVEKVPVQSIIDLTKSERKVEGILSGQFQGSASNTLPSVVGGGAIRYETEKYQVEGPFGLKEGIVESDNLVITLGGGRIGIRGKGNLVDAPMVFDGGILVEKVPVQSLIGMTGSDREVEGDLYGQFQGKVGSNLASVSGAGAIRVVDGKLYSVPVIGQMRSFLAGVLPTFGKVQKSDLQGSFTMDQGILNTQDLIAASDMTRVEVAGVLNFNDMTADFTAQAKVDGVVGVATDVVSGLLEIEASGPVSDLDIRLKNGAAGMAAGAVKDTVDMAKTGVNGLTQGAKSVGGTAVRAGTKGVKKGVKTVGKGLGKLIPGLGKKDEPEEVPPVTEVPLSPAAETEVPVPQQ